MAILENSTDWQGLQERAITGIGLAVGAFVCLYCGGVVFNVLVILAAILMMKEWDALTLPQPVSLHVAGFPLIIVPTSCIIWLRTIEGSGFALVLTLVAVVTATDTAAYFVGNRYGEHKLAPRISPKKTWEGLGGGVVGALLVGLIGGHFVHIEHSILSVAVISILTALLAQTGDLLKSWVKRRAGVKDSGTLLPGHGGVIDRLDGYFFTAPLLALLVSLAI